MPATAEHPFPVVGVGASAGGLSALTNLLDALPPRPGLALVVIQHLDPRYESRLNELLQPHTSMAVMDANHGTKVAPDHVYVIQPNTSVAIADGILSVTARPDDRQPHYPVDHFLRSLASVQGPSAVGVILSGTGSDGTLGICEIKAAGGITFAQDEHSAQHTGMPRSAAASGAVDLVLPPNEIAERLAAVRKHPYLSAADHTGADEHEDPESFQRVIVALRNTSTGRPARRRTAPVSSVSRAGTFSARRNAWWSDATGRRAPWSITTSRSSISTGARRRTSRPQAGSRPPTSCAWPSKVSSWTCAAP